MSCDKVEIARICHIFDHKHHRCAEDIPVWQLPGKEAYFFLSKMATDVDGAPRGYHPRDKNPPDNHTKALDWLANLSASDRHGIQGADGIGPEPSFIVSGTSLQDKRRSSETGKFIFPENDTRHYVDAEKIPYIVLPGTFPSGGTPVTPIELGDCAMVIDLKSGRSSGAIFADIGRAVGEASLRLALNLNLDPTASRHPPKVIGFNRVDFLYIVFPDSKVPPPWDVDEIRRIAEDKFSRWGGLAQVKDCFPNAHV